MWSVSVMHSSILEVVKSLVLFSLWPRFISQRVTVGARQWLKLLPSEENTKDLSYFGEMKQSFSALQPVKHPKQNFKKLYPSL